MVRISFRDLLVNVIDFVVGVVDIFILTISNLLN